MGARDDYSIGHLGDASDDRTIGELLNIRSRMCDEIDRLREAAALGLEIQWEIEKWGDPYLMGVRARVSSGDGFTQNGEEVP